MADYYDENGQLVEAGNVLASEDELNNEILKFLKSGEKGFSRRYKNVKAIKDATAGLTHLSEGDIAEIEAEELKAELIELITTPRFYKDYSKKTALDTVNFRIYSKIQLNRARNGRLMDMLKTVVKEQNIITNAEQNTQSEKKGLLARLFSR